MKKFLLAILLLSSFISAMASNEIEKKDHITLYQVATIDSLTDGVLDGDYSFEELSKHGNFGLGTFNHLDGEMVAVDGNFYQITANGRLNKVKPAELTPFAEVTFFKPQQHFNLQNIDNLNDLTATLDSHINNKNVPFAIRIEGVFSNLKLRSIPRQYKPYPKLETAATSQHIYNLTNTKGTIIGFYFPKYFSTIAVSGFHLHFVTSDHTTGGHILDLKLLKGSVYLQALHQVKIMMPYTKDFKDAHLGNPTNAESINRVEKDPAAK